MIGPSVEPKVSQDEDGVTVHWEGRVLPPPLPPLPRKRHCPHCGAKVTRQHRYATTDTAYFFECWRCMDPETCRPTRFKDPR